MGLIVQDTLTLPNGLNVSSYYVNLGEMDIKKSYKVDTGDKEYSIRSEYKCYATRQARIENKEALFTFTTIILTPTLVDIETNLYTDIKQNYENYTDDL
jgi:hypothetical protein